MNICGYENTDLINGDGVRTSLWVSGCSHKCKGCFNKKFWSYTSGKLYTEEDQEKLLADLSRPFIKGLSVLGGEPLDSENIEFVIDILNSVRKKFGGSKDIYLWTGYTFENIPEEIKILTDVIIDGKFEKDNPTEKKFRGSDNQRLWRKTPDGWEVD